MILKRVMYRWTKLDLDPQVSNSLEENHILFEAYVLKQVMYCWMKLD